MKLKSDEFVILAVLTEGEQHGSEIMRGVYRLTKGGLVVRSSGLFSILHGLTNKGLIESCKRPQKPAGPIDNRTYYRITPLGHQTVQNEVEARVSGK